MGAGASVTALAEAVFDYLSNDPGVSALVGDRIYPFRLPEKIVVTPGVPGFIGVTWQQVSAGSTPTFDPVEEYDTWISARVQFNCWAYTGDGAMTLGEAVLAALSGYDGSIGGDLIQSSFLVNELDIYEVPTKFFRRILEFQISYEDVPAAS